jgi:ABC-type dipeptide/oligopeptide/nickel transport system permease subunit
MRRSIFFVTGFTCAVVVVLTVIFGPMLMDWDPARQSLIDRFIAPQGFADGFQGHIIGTDQLGRDVMTRLLLGGRSSLFIALIAVFAQNLLGIILGIIAGYFRGLTDEIVMRACEVFLAIPNIVLAIAVIAVIGTSVFNLIMVLSITGWVRLCKVIRNDVIVFSGQEFVSASRTLGAGNLHIMFKQIFPNITTNLLVIGSQSLGGVLMMESVLSFLNLGIQAPNPSWGNMINVGRGYLTTYPWLAIAPGVALMLAILSFNFLGDGLRDIFDPKWQG